ncbi:endogenous retrovirus group K member 113 Gag polyprotein-like [Meleagris gallopavo]|uniref:endogenous retrovirus group K member 113 Gag polyprotein-like n=1 Tax=Meleagris gallopavo TaxID=9103 RepID=UPI000549C64A|nr:endogenous retrovirus group K member 113 Gag polyprotein-like [Meleagris gallopavo]
MESVIKVLIYACKIHCGKSAPSKKDVAAVLTLLEREGLLHSPHEVYDPGRWDSLTAALSQRAMSTQRAAELKTWGLILGALKATREEKTAEDLARDFLGLGLRGDSGEVAEIKGGGGGMGPPNSPGNDKKEGEKMATAKEGTTLETIAPEKTEEQRATAPPPYPCLYPSLKNLAGEGNDERKLGGGERAQPLNLEPLCSPVLPACPALPETEIPAPCPLTDWGKIREELRAAELSAECRAFPVETRREGPVWVPLNPKTVARLAETIEKKGLRSPATISALEAIVAPGPMLPYDIEGLMKVVLEPVQFTLWKEEWSVQIRAVVAAASRDPRHLANGRESGEHTSFARLLGYGEGMVGSPEGQLRHLRPGELLATTEAAVAAFRRFARTAEPPSPWSDIMQGPTESFQDFANRLIRAVEESELPRTAHNAIIVDCLKQKSHKNIKDLIRAAPDSLNTPGDIIKYVLEKQKTTPLTNEGLALVAAMSASESQSKGPCFKCGQFGHLRAHCGNFGNRRPGNSNINLTCQACGKGGHSARQCRKFVLLLQGNERGEAPRAQGPSPLNMNGPVSHRGGRGQTPQPHQPPLFSRPQ